MDWLPGDSGGPSTAEFVADAASLGERAPPPPPGVGRRKSGGTRSLSAGPGVRRMEVDVYSDELAALDPFVAARRAMRALREVLMEAEP